LKNKKCLSGDLAGVSCLNTTGEWVRINKAKINKFFKYYLNKKLKEHVKIEGTCKN
jgi:hypothetical protein